MSGDVGHIDMLSLPPKLENLNAEGFYVRR